MELIFDLDTLIYKAGFAAEQTLRKLYIDGDEVGVYTSHKDVISALAEHDITMLSNNKFPEEREAERVEIKKLHLIEPESKAVQIADQLLSGLLDRFEGYNYQLFMKGTSPWRYDVWPLYKHSREGAPKPKHYYAIIEHYGRKFGAKVPADLETDDACSIAAYKALINKKDYIIASVDKDLLQIPGEHFNYQHFFEGKESFTNIDFWEAEVNLYQQILSGDSTDDIPGIRGIGPAGAKRILEGCDDQEELFVTALNKYREFYGDDALEVMTMNANLVYLLRKPNEFWKPPLVI